LLIAQKNAAGTPSQTAAPKPRQTPLDFKRSSEGHPLDIPADGTLTQIEAVVPEGPQRFFVVVEKGTP
jgi:hypothetical protein